MKKTGFTLIESAIVLVILGLVVTLLVPPLVGSIRHEKLQENKDALLSLRHALVDIARQNNQGVLLPASLGEVGLPEQDTWGSPYAYLAMDTDICAQGGSGIAIKLEPENQMDEKNQTIAFLIASAGPDRRLSIIDENTTINLSNRGDDLVEFMSRDQLIYHACR